MPRVKSLKSPFLRDKIINLGEFCKRLKEEKKSLYPLFLCYLSSYYSVTTQVPWPRINWRIFSIFINIL